MYQLFIAAILSLALISCSEEGLNIVIHSPENGTVYAQGASINISFTVTDGTDIKEIGYYSSNLGRATLSPSELIGNNTEYTGSFSIIADADPGRNDITVIAFDNMFSNVEEVVSVEIE